jgi:class 3 adenylate cyclase
LNKIQEIAISRYVPTGFLKLLGATRITDVALGKYVQKDLTMLLLKVKDFSKRNKDKTAEEIFHSMNGALDLLSPIIRSHGGFVDRFDGDGFMAIFTNPKRALKAGVGIQSTIDILNQNTDTKSAMSLRLAIHSGEMLLGTIGERARMQGAIVSHHSETTILLERLAKRFDVKILATNDTMKSAGKLMKFMQYRIIGRLYLDHAHVHEDVYEILRDCDKKKVETKELFESAVHLFRKGQYEAAQQAFAEVLKIIPDDQVSISYEKKCHQLIAECNYLSPKVSILSILVDEVLLNDFGNFCKKEHSNENIDLWKEIETFKTVPTTDERRELASKLRKKYLSLSGMYTININGKLKENVAEKLSTNSDIHESLFDQIQKELEFVMSDTVKRYKSSDEFTKAFPRSSAAPAIPDIASI